jgi:hypothetical protein
VDPRAGLDDVEKRKFLTLPALKLQPLSRPARSQSLYRLRSPGSGYVGYHQFYLGVLGLHVVACGKYNMRKENRITVNSRILNHNNMYK